MRLEDSVFYATNKKENQVDNKNPNLAARPEWSSFYGAQWNKKAGTEGGKSCHKKIKKGFST